MISIAVAQTAPAFLDAGANHSGAIDLIGEVDADLYLFPELYLSGYAFSTEDEVRRCALRPDNPIFDQLKRLSSERGIAVCGGYVEASGGALYNSAFLIGNGQILSNYRKTHLFFREKEFFTPGDSGFQVVEYLGVRFGMMICFDWIFPEAARSLALRGAQVILHPANLVLPYCQRAMFARAVENRVFVATANRVGTESNAFGDELTFTGRSQLVTPGGEYVLTFDDGEVAIRSVEIDPAAAAEKQLNPYNDVLGDRRPGMYL